MKKYIPVFGNQNLFNGANPSAKVVVSGGDAKSTYFISGENPGDVGFYDGSFNRPIYVAMRRVIDDLDEDNFVASFKDEQSQINSDGKEIYERGLRDAYRKIQNAN